MIQVPYDPDWNEASMLPFYRRVRPLNFADRYVWAISTGKSCYQICYEFEPFVDDERNLAWLQRWWPDHTAPRNQNPSLASPTRIVEYFEGKFLYALLT